MTGDNVDTPKILTIIVTYGDRGHFVQAVATEALSQGVNKVAVIGNGLTPRVAQTLKDRLPVDRSEIYLLPENFGSAGGFGFGITLAADSPSYDAVWLLDDDNLPEPGCLEALLHALATSDADAVIPMRNDPQLIAAAEGHLPPPPGSYLYQDVGTRIARFLDRKRTEPRLMPKIPYAPYGGLLVNQSILKSVDCPRADFILYEDDSEYTWRLTQAGHPIRLVTKSSMRDLQPKWIDEDTASRGAVFNQNAPRQYFSIRNRTHFDLMRASNEGRLTIVRFATNIGLYTFASIFGNLRGWATAPLYGYLRALRHGLARRTGLSGIHSIDDPLHLSEMKGFD